VISVLTTISGVPIMTAATTAGIASFAPDECPFSLLLQLDDITQPGLSEEKFRDLFSKCRKCDATMTRRVTVFHHCKAGANPEVIDLTNED
jgi:hypothetical protein